MATATETQSWDDLCEAAFGGFTLTQLPANIELPALPHAVTEFVERSEDPEVGMPELAKIIETDSGLTTELLRHVNSTFVGLRHKASSVGQTLSLLGKRQSKMFLIATGMQAAVRSRKSKLINQQCFWNASLQKAIFSREVATLLRADADMAFAGSLLQDFLLPVITNDLFEGYLKLIQTRDAYPDNIIEFERSEFGWDHAVAGAYLAYRWHLPRELVCCILYHHHGLHTLANPGLTRTSVAAVAISALLPDQLRQYYSGLEQLLVLEQKWPAFQLETLVRKVDAEHEQMGLGVSNDFPLERRCKPVLNKMQDICDGTLNVDINAQR